MFSNHPQWPNVNSIISRISKSGFKAWLAGGCVRDYLMNKLPQDFDIVTDAKPNEIETLFPNALEVGKKFGIIILPFNGYQIEVATFRKDGEYKDGRHPETVSFATPEEDARRRDFTINSLFFDPLKNEIHDFVGGRTDIGRKLIRTVGDPARRFDEDKLRVLRAFRFCSQLGFEVDTETFTVASSFSVAQVSRERIRIELYKLLVGQNRLRALSLLEQAGILTSLLPECADALYKRVFVAGNLNPWLLSKLLLSQIDVSQYKDLIWVLLLAPILKASGIENLAGLTARFRLARDEVNRLDFIGQHWESFSTLEKHKNSYLLLTFAHKFGRDLYDFYSTLAVILQASVWDRISKEVTPVLPPQGKLPKAWVSAQDLMALGITGAQLGECLKKSFAWQLDRECKNREEILEKIKKAEFTRLF